jgi:pyrroline-5-carboxylate reductase
VSSEEEPTGDVAVIGAGNMGKALIRGLLGSGWTNDQILATGPDPAKMEDLRETLGVQASTDNVKGAAFGETVVVAVKPQIIDGVLDEIAAALAEDALVISVAAGVPTSRIQAHLPDGQPVVRTMPNLPATVGYGATAMCAGEHARETHLATTRRLFESVGAVVEIEEGLMDAVTGLSGTGPMYVFQIIEGLSDAGVKVGLSREDAHELAMQTVLGSAVMARESGQHPAELKDRVTSPAGTGIEALHAMERGGLRALLIDAVEVATERSVELGEDGD